MEELPHRTFVYVLLRACAVSLAVFILFALTGEPLLSEYLGVRPAAMRIFGGAIFLIVAYNYVTKGYKGAEVLRGTVEELPSAIALPFMIGAGTLTQSILIGKQLAAPAAVLVLTVGIGLTFLTVLIFKPIRDRVQGTRERVFERYVNILARVNGLIIGAIFTEMVVGGIHDMWA